MKIYEIGTGYTPIPATMGAATEIVVEELTKAFVKLGEDVEIVDIAAADRAPHNLPIREVKVPKCFAGTDVKLGLMHKLKRVTYSIFLAGELKKILRSSSEKMLLHFHNQYNLYFFLKLTPRKLRKKAVVAYTNHSGIWRMPWNEIEEIIRKRYFQEAECMKRADVVFVLNDETIHNATTHLKIPSDRFVKIDNGVNIDVYHPLSQEEQEATKQSLGLGGKKVILQVGSVNANKGQARTLEMLKPLLQEEKEIVFAYAGGIVSEEYQQQVSIIAEKYGVQDQVHYLGVVQPGEELNRIYNIAAATIMASKFESFGMVVIESLSAGVPVLLLESFPRDFGQGIVRYSEDVCIEQVREVLYAGGYCLKARENAQHNFAWSKVATDYLRGLASLM